MSPSRLSTEIVGIFVLRKTKSHDARCFLGNRCCPRACLGRVHRHPHDAQGRPWKSVSTAVSTAARTAARTAALTWPPRKQVSRRKSPLPGSLLRGRNELSRRNLLPTGRNSLREQLLRARCHVQGWPVLRRRRMLPAGHEDASRHVHGALRKLLLPQRFHLHDPRQHRLLRSLLQDELQRLQRGKTHQMRRPVRRRRRLPLFT